MRTPVRSMSVRIATSGISTSRNSCSWPARRHHRQQFLREAQGDIGILGGVDRGLLDLDLVEADLLLAAAGHLRCS